MNSRYFTRIGAVSLSLYGFLLVSSARADELSQSFIAGQYAKFAPAICIVKYSSDVTNPSTGESTKRDIQAPGLLVSADGLVMAHGHMQYEDTEPFNISVLVGEGENRKEYGAKLLRKPEDVNICFLRIQSDTPLQVPFVHFEPNGELGLGEPFILLGLMRETLDNARGMLVRRVGSILDKPRKTYCVDEGVPFGYVGSPVINGRGQVVGVVGFDLSSAEGGEVHVRSGHPLVYQSALFLKYIQNPPSETEVEAQTEAAWLGVFAQPLTDDLAEYWNLRKEGGIVVSSIVAGSPAETAGFQRGDVITDFNGTPMKAKENRDVVGFTNLVRDTGVDAQVNVQLLRKGEPMTLTVKLAPRPKSSSQAEEFVDETFGLTVREITTDLRIVLNLPDDVQGVIVRRVKSGSWADLAGMRTGVIVMAFGDNPTRNLEEFQQAVAKVVESKPAEVPVFCRAGAQTGFFRMQPRWDVNAEK